MTDRQKGLAPAIEELLQEVEHRFCIRHLHNNFKKKFLANSLKDQLWKCLRSTHPNQFTDNMKILQVLDPHAYEWLVKSCNAKHWFRAYFRNYTKYDLLLNNLCESFNATIMQARGKPILGMVECIRTYWMTRHEVKRGSVKNNKEFFVQKFRSMLSI